MGKNFQEIAGYLWHNKIYSLVTFYFFISVLVKIFLNMEIGIPCIWKSLLGFECPGCGLTTALINLVQLNFVAAYKSNPLIFIVIPGKQEQGLGLTRTQCLSPLIFFCGYV